MSDTFTSTVDGTVSNFSVMYEPSGGARSVEGKAATSTRLLPYGPAPSTVVQSAGGWPLVRTHKLFFQTYADWTNLQHCRGHHGTLAIAEGTFDVTVDNVKGEWLGFGVDQQDCTAIFIHDTL